MTSSKFFTLSLAVASIIVSSCTNTVLTNITVKRSNPAIIDGIKILVDNADYQMFYQLSTQIKLPSTIKSKINATDKIAIYSEDRLNNTFKDFQNLLEKGLTKSCLDAGMIVLERNYIPLVRIYSENHNIPTMINVSQEPPTVKECNASDYQCKADTIQAANKIISYTVFDAGMKKYTSNDSSKITRCIGLLMQFKLIDPVTSKILAYQDTNIFISDEVPADLNALAQGFHFDNTHAIYPLHSQTSSQTANATPSNLGISSLNSLFNKAQGAESWLPIEKIVNTGSKPESVSFDFNCSAYELDGSIVNPVDSSSLVSFSIPSSSKTTFFTYKWDLKNKKGEIMPPGRYYLQIKNKLTGAGILRKDFQF